tara:strand:+ start:858 stop:1301 length:444 start_codon:yes stop_codon:yes gene_type:complete
MTIAGGCQCGAVRFRFEGPIAPAYACHCGECKKQSASAFSMSMPMLFSDLTVQGDCASFATKAHSGKTKHNYFCGQCGTRLCHSPSNPPEAITLKVGTLDDPSGIAPLGHLWVSKKQPGFELDPQSDQHLTQPDDLNQWRASLGSGK